MRVVNKGIGEGICFVFKNRLGKPRSKDGEPRDNGSHQNRSLRLSLGGPGAKVGGRRATGTLPNPVYASSIRVLINLTIVCKVSSAIAITAM